MFFLDYFFEHDLGSYKKHQLFIYKVNLEIKEAGTARKIATVSFDAAEVSKKESQACNEISRVANIPGFRKGKDMFDGCDEKACVSNGCRRSKRLVP